MKHAAFRRIVVSLLLAMVSATAVQARRQGPAAPPTVAPMGVWDWLENALTTTPNAAPLTVADSPILGVWRLRSVDGAPRLVPSDTMRQYISHPDGFLAMTEVTIDEHAVPRFTAYSAKPGVSSAQYTDESFARFLLNGTRTADAVSFRLVDRNTLSVVVSTGANPVRRSTLSLSAAAATLTEVSESLDSAGSPGARETRVFGRLNLVRGPEQSPVDGPLGPFSPNPTSPAPLTPPLNPLIGSWNLNEAKSPTKSEAGSMTTLLRFIDLGRGAFGTLLIRVSRSWTPYLEMAVVKFEGPDDLVLALPIYTLAQIQIFLERETLPASAVAYKLIDARTVESTSKSMSTGKVSAVATRRFTENFLEFTETRKSFDIQGKPAGETVTVYNKIGPN